MRAQKVSFAVLLVVLCLLFTACSNSFFAGHTAKNSTSAVVSMTYDEFNDIVNKNIVLDQGKTCEVVFDITTKSGKLDLSLTGGQDGSQNYTGNNVSTSNFTYTLTEPQTYTLTIHGDHHSGGYKISWSIK